VVSAAASGKIGEQREPEILVVISQGADFQSLDKLLHASGGRQDGRHRDDRPQVIGTP
jgi:hypothetical protein